LAAVLSTIAGIGVPEPLQTDVARSPHRSAAERSSISVVAVLDPDARRAFWPLN
jgi:hypothetical protein